MYTTQAYQQYRTMQAQTADRGELVVMLYEGAIKFLSRASAALQAGNLEESHSNLVRCQDIIAELMGTLNMEAGEIAQDLFRIYEYMHYSLVQANLHKDPQPINEVSALLRELLPAWRLASMQARSAETGAQTLPASRLCYAAG